MDKTFHMTEQDKFYEDRIRCFTTAAVNSVMLATDNPDNRQRLLQCMAAHVISQITLIMKQQNPGMTSLQALKEWTAGLERSVQQYEKEEELIKELIIRSLMP